MGGHWESAAATAVAEAAELNPWELIKAKLAERIAPQEFQNWVMQTALQSLDQGLLRVQVPDQVTKDFIEQEYTDYIRSTIRELNLPVEKVVYLPNAETRSAAAADNSSLSSSSSSSAEPVFASAAGQLNTRFRFDNFVVGSCNQFAHAAARAVADSPSRSYNPLFIYGGVGMGKTHLMHAIGRGLLDKYPSLRVVYTSSERFMNEMILCLRTNRMPSFQRHYRSADVLLVDDVQILGGKERMQEEFFHTFNELHDHQKQIVISSDSAPKSTPGLVERLRSRFEWGLMVDVQPPDLETKMAILDKKAELEGVALPEEVRIYIATKTKSNVRELEGALIKLIAYSSITNSPITLQMAQQVLKYLISNGDRRITMDSILRAVAEKHNLQPQQLKQKSNTRAIAYPRQIAMYLMKDLTQASLPEIGRVFGGKHHTTVLHSVQKIERLRQTDSDLNRLIHSLIDSVH
ncbi:MAG: chromosomal replication initiator protein DnaA [Bryobacterales bacterium]|nr:chromosomal replication initiator protein DnaA [Bryobacterales bacterium]